MKMKKWLLSVLSIVAGLCLVACKPQVTVIQSDDSYTATLEVAFSEDKVVKEEVTFDADDTVMDILEDHFDVEEENGFVTSIDGVSQDNSKQLFWMYDINGELAPKGAEEMEVSDGDTISFYLQQY